MDEHRFDCIMHALTRFASRRSLVGGVLSTTGGWLGVRDAHAKPKRRKKRKRPKPAKPNAYGCLEVNDPCRRHTQCCSGICTGKPGRKRCRAHGAGTCSQEGAGICTAPYPELLRCNNDVKCFCFRTTAGSNFCGNWSGYKDCAACKRDPDCHALGFPVGSACVPVAQGHCTVSGCANGMVCMAPCGVEPPAPTP